MISFPSYLIAARPSWSCSCYMLLHNTEYDLADFEPDIPFPTFFLYHSMLPFIIPQLLFVKHVCPISISLTHLLFFFHIFLDNSFSIVLQQKSSRSATTYRLSSIYLTICYTTTFHHICYYESRTTLSCHEWHVFTLLFKNIQLPYHYVFLQENC